MPKIKFFKINMMNDIVKNQSDIINFDEFIEMMTDKMSTKIHLKI